MSWCIERRSVLQCFCDSFTRDHYQTLWILWEALETHSLLLEPRMETYINFYPFYCSHYVKTPLSNLGIPPRILQNGPRTSWAFFSKPGHFVAGPTAPSLSGHSKLVGQMCLLFVVPFTLTDWRQLLFSILYRGNMWDRQWGPPNASSVSKPHYSRGSLLMTFLLLSEVYSRKILVMLHCF